MSDIREDGASFIGYEYKEIPAGGERASFCLDCYQNFGWVLDEHTPEQALRGKGKLVLKRNRRIVNKMELTRLQRHFEACLDELDALERSKTSCASLCAIIIGLIGTVFLAGSTFSGDSSGAARDFVRCACCAGIYRMDSPLVFVSGDGAAAYPGGRSTDGAKV